MDMGRGLANISCARETSVKISSDSELLALRSVDDRQPNYFWTSLKIVQSWLISFAVHLVIVASLATIVMPVLPTRSVLSIQALVNEEKNEKLEELAEFILSDAEVSLPNIGDEPKLIDEAVYSEIPDPEIQLPSSFFGAHVSGQRIAFVIDRSSSMRGTKFDHARDEVVRAVNQLVPTQSFYVIFFDRGILRMFGKDDTVDTMLPATPANLQRFNTWVSQLKVGSGTMPYRSVKLIMAMQPDTLFLLTDGNFNSGDKTVAYFNGSKTNGVKIHTIGFHHQDDGTLEKIAQKHSGTFRFVSRDKKKE